MTKNVSTTCCLSIVHVFSVAYTFHSSFTAADRQLWPLPDPRADKHGGEAEATLGSTSGQGARLCFILTRAEEKTMRLLQSCRVCKHLDDISLQASRENLNL